MEKLMKSLSAMLIIAAGIFSCQTVSAQNAPQSPEQQEKQLTEYIQKQVEKYETNLKLEDWQTFYVDSILTHDYHAMAEELQSLNASKVANSDIYVGAQDKWNQAVYDAFRKIFTDQQWDKYLKMGAAREQKGREKRKAQSEGK